MCPSFAHTCAKVDLVASNPRFTLSGKVPFCKKRSVSTKSTQNGTWVLSHNHCADTGVEKVKYTSYRNNNHHTISYGHLFV